MLFIGLFCLNSESFVFDEELLRNILILGLNTNLALALLLFTPLASFPMRFVNEHNELTIMLFLLLHGLDLLVCTCVLWLSLLEQGIAVFIDVWSFAAFNVCIRSKKEVLLLRLDISPSDWFNLLSSHIFNTRLSDCCLLLLPLCLLPSSFDLDDCFPFGWTLLPMLLCSIIFLVILSKMVLFTLAPSPLVRDDSDDDDEDDSTLCSCSFFNFESVP